MRNRSLVLRLSTAASLLLFFVACGAADGSSGNTPLEGILWRLVDFGPVDAPVAALADVSVTVKFDAGNTVGGSGGCNSYGGNYQLNGQSLSVSQVVSTMMACENTDVMQQESRYLAALGSATGLHVAGTELTIDYAGGKLHFTRI